VYALWADGSPHHFLSTGSDGCVVRWHVDEPGNGLVLARVERPVFTALSAGEHRLFLGDMDGGLHLVDLRQHVELQLERAHDKGVFALEFLPDGRLVTGGGDGCITVWETTGPEDRPIRMQRRIPLTDAKVRGLALDPGGALIAAARGDGLISLLDTTDLNEHYTLKGHDIGANCLAWHPRKPVLLSGGKDGHVRLWHAHEDFRPLQAFPAHKDHIYRIAFSPDGRFFATASRDKTAKVWDAGTLEPVRRLDRHHGGHGYSVNVVLWLAETLLTASDDKSIVAWEALGSPSAG
jgi:WD40 repeat protein